MVWRMTWLECSCSGAKELLQHQPSSFMHTHPLTSNSSGASTAATAQGSCRGAPLWNLNTSLNAPREHQVRRQTI